MKRSRVRAELKELFLFLFLTLGVFCSPGYAQKTVSVQEVMAIPGQTIEVGIQIGDLKLSGASFTLDFSKRTPPEAPNLSASNALAGPIATGMIVQTNATENQVRVALIGTAEVKGPGVLVKIPFNVPKNAIPGSSYQLELVSAEVVDLQLNTLPVTIQNGTLKVVSASPSAVKAVVVGPVGAEVVVGQTLQLTAQGLDDQGNPIPGLQFAWGVEEGQASGSVDSQGLFKALAPGQVKVSASVAGVTGSLVIKVLPAPIGAVVRVGSLKGFAGSVVKIPVQIGSIQNVAGFDFVLNFAEAQPKDAPPLVVGTPEKGVLTSSTLIESRYDSDQKTLRIVLVGAQGINGPGEIALVPVIIPTGTVPGTIYFVKITNIQLADPSGQPVLATGEDGTLIIEAQAGGPPVSLTITPSEVQVAPGGSFQFKVEGKDAQGIVIPNPSVSWIVEPAELGNVTRTGLFTASGTGKGVVKAISNENPNIVATANVIVGALADNLLFIPSLQSAPGTSVWVPLKVTNLSFAGADILIDFTAVQPSTAPPLSFLDIQRVGTLVESALVQINTQVPGHVRIGIVSGSLLKGPGTVLLVGFKVPTDAPLGAVYTLKIAFAELNDEMANPINVVIQDGSLVITEADTIPPVVSVEGVQEGSIVRGKVTLKISATDDRGVVTSVTLTADDATTPLAKLENPPYEIVVDTTTLTDGDHLLTISAVDPSGNLGKTSVKLTVYNTPPQVAVEGVSANQQIRGTIKLRITVSKTKAPTEIKLSVEGGTDLLASAKGPSAEINLDTTQLPNQVVNLIIAATDPAGNEGKISLPLRVDNIPPVAVITAPTSKQVVAGVLIIQGSANDGDTSADTFAGYQLEIGAGEAPSTFNPVGTLQLLPVFSGKLGELDTSKLQPGTYTLRLTSKDKAGNTSQAQVSFTVELPVLPMDLNGDGRVSIPDATLALRIAIGLLKPTPRQLLAGDLNKDGKISVPEVTQILRKAVGK